MDNAGKYTPLQKECTRLPQTKKSAIFKKMKESGPKDFGKFIKRFPIGGLTPQSVVARTPRISTKVDAYLTSSEGGETLLHLGTHFFVEKKPTSKRMASPAIPRIREQTDTVHQRRIRE